jgi:hypothetical protein
MEREDKKEARKEKGTKFFAKSIKGLPCQELKNGHFGDP